MMRVMMVLEKMKGRSEKVPLNFRMSTFRVCVKMMCFREVLIGALCAAESSLPP